MEGYFNPAAFQTQSLSCLPAKACTVTKRSINKCKSSRKANYTYTGSFLIFLEATKDGGCHDELRSSQATHACQVRCQFVRQNDYFIVWGKEDCMEPSDIQTLCRQNRSSTDWFQPLFCPIPPPHFPSIPE